MAVETSQLQQDLYHTELISALILKRCFHFSAVKKHKRKEKYYFQAKFTVGIVFGLLFCGY